MCGCKVEAPAYMLIFALPSDNNNGKYRQNSPRDVGGRRTDAPRSLSRKRKMMSDADQLEGTDRMCFLKMSASSQTGGGDDDDVVCGGLAICWMLSSFWDYSLILGPELWNNPPPPSAPLSPSPSVCPEDRHPDSTRSHYSHIYKTTLNNNNHKYRNINLILAPIMSFMFCGGGFFHSVKS